jgi:hypothetical protein
MQIVITGSRSDRSEWEAVQKIPREQLPPLTPEQQHVAEELRIREDDYQRSILAGKQTGEKLLKKTEWFAKLLQRNLGTRAPGATIRSVLLDTGKERFEIAIEINGDVLPLHVAEGIVDDFFDLGSTRAEQSLGQMLEQSLHRLGVS